MHILRKQIVFVCLICAAIWSVCGIASATGKPVQTGVHGIVGLSPGCPGPQLKDQSCDRPLADKEVQLIDRAGKVVGKAITAEDGKFVIPARHGKYVVKVVIDALYPRCPTRDVTVRKRGLADANINCDSGMR